MSKVSYVLQGDTIVLVVDSQTHTVGPDHPNHGLVVEALKDGELDGIVDLINMERVVANFSDGKLVVEDGEVLYDGDPIHSSLQTRLLDMIDQGFDVDPLINFIGNLFLNPSKRATEETYSFLEKNSLPITSDGHFLAYKNVGADYKDIHSSSFDNRVGMVCEMPRNKVQEDRNITCSSGLHFCGLSYLGSFSGAHTMILKINPRDVVSIPSDYNDAKGRACRYEVVGEHVTEDRSNTPAFDRVVQDEGGLDTRAVLQLDREDDEVVDEFANVAEAADAMGVPVGYIARVLRGDRPATAGYRWEYEDEYDG